MAFGILQSQSARIQNPAAAVMNFGAAESVNDIWLVNNSGSAVTVTLWLDYDGVNASDTELLGVFSLRASGDRDDRDKKHITGLWVFANGGRITAECSVDLAATIHISKATV